MTEKHIALKTILSIQDDEERLNEYFKFAKAEMKLRSSVLADIKLRAPNGVLVELPKPPAWPL